MTDDKRETINRIGFFGGSFDPVHQGHLIAAQDAFEQLFLSSLHFIPAAQAPLRGDSVRASDADRLRMLQLALGDDPRFDVSDIEIARGGTSYTIDTVLTLREQHPHARLIWIIGDDQLAKLPRWHRIEELCRLAEFACFGRPGHEPPATPDIPGLRLHRLKSHQVELSSTEIRQRNREKRPLRFLLPEAVITYIYEQQLYR